MSAGFSRKPLSIEEKDYAYSALKRQIFKEIRELFKRLFTLKGVTQNDIAERLTADKGLISRRLNGDANLTLRTLAELLAAMDAKLQIKAQLYSDLLEVENNQLKTIPAPRRLESCHLISRRVTSPGAWHSGGQARQTGNWESVESLVEVYSFGNTLIEREKRSKYDA